MNVTIRNALPSDISYLSEHDRWVNRQTICEKIEKNQIYVVFSGETFVGWLRYHLFWDNTPFLSMLHLLSPYRGKGIGRQLVRRWEEDMKQQGYPIVLASTAQTETAQFFYGKLGYQAIGSFTLEDEPLELLFSKRLFLT